MPKDKKTINKKIKGGSVQDDLEEIEVGEPEEIEEVEEVLPDDVRDALGINKAEKAAKIKEVDYISELESDLDGLGLDDSPAKPSFDDDFEDFD